MSIYNNKNINIDTLGIINTNKFSLNILFLEEFFSLEDFGGFNMIINSIKTKVGLGPNLNKKEEITSTTIRANFMVDNKEKEILIERNDLNKIFAFIRIYSNVNNFINIVMFRSDKYDKNDIINRINSIHFFRGAFKVKLKICIKSCVYFLANSSLISPKSDKLEIINKANFLAKNSFLLNKNT